MNELAQTSKTSPVFKTCEVFARFSRDLATFALGLGASIA